MSTTLPTWDDLYQWVCSKEDKTIVGEAGLASKCPIATYLKETRDEKWNIRVDCAWYQWFSPEEICVAMENWQTQVVREVDTFGDGVAIPASVFKSILEDISSHPFSS